MSAIVELEEEEVIMLRVYLMLQYHRADTSAKTRTSLSPLINKLERAEREIKFRKRQDDMLHEPKEDTAFD